MDTGATVAKGSPGVPVHSQTAETMRTVLSQDTYGSKVQEVLVHRGSCYFREEQYSTVKWYAIGGLQQSESMYRVTGDRADDLEEIYEIECYGENSVANRIEPDQVP